MDIINSVPILGPCLADLSQCAEAFKIGLFNGLIIALIAIGYTLVYGILQLINFANGDVFMVGTMLTWIGVSAIGLHEGSPAILVVVTLVVLLVATMLITAGLNASIERLAYRPLRNAPTLATLISAIGMSFILQNVGQAIIGPSPRSVPQLLSNKALFEIGGVSFALNELFVAAITDPAPGRLDLVRPEDPPGQGDAGHRPGSRGGRLDGHQHQPDDLADVPAGGRPGRRRWPGRRPVLRPDLVVLTASRSACSRSPRPSWAGSAT